MKTVASLAAWASLTSLAAAAPAAKRAANCPAGFRNVVFNSGASTQPNWPGRFDFLQTYGITNWIGFTDMPNPTADAAVNGGQIRVVMDPTHISEAIEIVTGDSPPAYLAIFNEPDLPPAGGQKVLPADAAAAVQPLLAVQTTTQFLSPAPAYPDSQWLPEFFGNCTGCLDRFPIIAAHIYRADSQQATELITTVSGQFQGKPLWLTEIAPASSSDQGCTLDPPGVTQWQNDVLGWVVSNATYVEKVFWNSGDYGILYPDNPTHCNPSLTNQDSTETSLLDNYGSFCG